MFETVSLDIGNPTRTKPTAAELAAALQLSSVTNATDIIASAWSEVEVFTRRLWGSRPATHVFRLLVGSSAPAFGPYRPVAEAVTVELWSSGAWETVPAADYEPDGIVRDLSQGSLYRVTASNLGNLGSSSPPVAVLEGVLRLAAFRASHRGGMFLPIDRVETVGYRATDALRKSGAQEVVARFAEFGS